MQIIAFYNIIPFIDNHKIRAKKVILELSSYYYHTYLNHCDNDSVPQFLSSSVLF